MIIRCQLISWTIKIIKLSQLNSIIELPLPGTINMEKLQKRYEIYSKKADLSYGQPLVVMLVVSMAGVRAG